MKALTALTALLQKLGHWRMNMPQMLWSGLCYFLDGARRHRILLEALSEQCAQWAHASFRKAGPIKNAERSI